MEKRNVIEQERTPEFKTAEVDEELFTATASEFKPTPGAGKPTAEDHPEDYKHGEQGCD